jgi:hypothetical protein
MPTLQSFDQFMSDDDLNIPAKRIRDTSDRADPFMKMRLLALIAVCGPH